MNLRLRLQRRWNQFRIETESRLAGFFGVIVNLHYIRDQSARVVQIIVLVDSWRETLLLALLRTLAVLPKHEVYVIRRSEDICRIVTGRTGETLILVTTSLYTKQYQSLLESDLKSSILIV